MNKLLYIIIGVVLLLACKPSVPRHIIQPDDMEDILVDYYLAKAMAQQTGKGQADHDFKQNLYIEGAFQKHGITQAEFDSAIIYYYAHAERLQEMYKHVGTRLEKQAIRLGATEGEIGRYAALNANGDTANIWSERTNLLLTPQLPRNKMEFELEADTSSRAGDVFLLHFMSDFMFQSGTKEGVAVLNVYYEEDTIVSKAVHFSSSGMNRLRIENPAHLTPKKVNGFFYIAGGENSNVLRLLFVNSIQLIRFHQEKQEVKNDSIIKNTEDSITPVSDAGRPTFEISDGGDSLRPRIKLLSPNRGDSQH